MFKARTLVAAAALATATAGGAAAAAAPVTWAATPPVGTVVVHAATHITGDKDGGGNGYWAVDAITRTLTVTVADSTVTGPCASLAGFSSADVCYTARLADAGTFTTITGAYQPNQGHAAPGQTGGKLAAVVSGTLTGSFGFTLFAPAGDAPSDGNVPATWDASAAAPGTSSWPRVAFGTAPAVTAGSDWTWTYTTGCESWTDSFVNGDGQSWPLATDGNITGVTCPAPTLPPAGNDGNYVNKYGNGLDVFRQHFTVNGQIAGWAATQHDPATRFARHILGNGNFTLAAAPDGAGTSLCVSNPMGGALPAGALPTGLVERSCNGSVFQQFKMDTAGHLISVVNGQFVNPAGTGAQMRTGPSAVPWGGSAYAWADYGSLPA